MKKIGIICEYNPFHNGHLEHLKNINSNDLIILVMSGNFVQRGDFSIINKFNKTQIALKFGVDLVIELPMIYANHAADYFAYESVRILNEFQVDEIVFGSESGSIPQTMTKSFNKSLPLGQLYDNSVQANEVLAIAYQNAVKKINSNIKLKPILRKPADDNICSATKIRELYLKKSYIKAFIPEISNFYLQKINYKQYFNILKLQSQNIILNEIAGCEEGLDARFLKFIYKSEDFFNLVEQMKSKKHSQYRIQRFLMNIALNITHNDVQKAKIENYLRVLGFSEKGQLYLKTLQNKDNLILNIKNNNLHTTKLEKRATNLYSLVSNDDPLMDFNPPLKG